MGGDPHFSGTPVTTGHRCFGRAKGGREGGRAGGRAVFAPRDRPRTARQREGLRAPCPSPALTDPPAAGRRPWVREPFAGRSPCQTQAACGFRSRPKAALYAPAVPGGGGPDPGRGARRWPRGRTERAVCRGVAVPTSSLR